MQHLAKEFPLTQFQGTGKYDLQDKHPIQNMQENNLFANEEAKMKRYGVTLGTSLPFRLTFERNCLAQGKRLPGEKSSLLGLEIHMNRLEQIDFEDFLNDETPEYKQENAHTIFLKQI